ncbi:hypothetical protein ACIRP5_19545 [Streptomyces sp. NPDC101221]|uniref:hypothetical protein n=1 Tax=Streptomyces sp. NPDC101221 TaxID=3366132 RepID=UPI0038097C8F
MPWSRAPWSRAPWSRAKGLPHAHVAAFDGFVAERCLDRFAKTAVKARFLTETAAPGLIRIT